jgi:predicted O-methyltransferase YrrM
MTSLARRLLHHFGRPAPDDAVPPPPPEITEPSIRTSHPNGHFYSPVVDPDEIARDADRIWPVHPEIPGIDFDDASHIRMLDEIFPALLPGYDYPERETADATQFFTQNSQFSWLDARALFVLLRLWKPRRLIEIGSGYSTLLSADVNRRFLDDSMQLTCIEPYPREFLARGIPGVTRLIEKKVQDVELELFFELEAGDVLFIDSSHVAKTGSDVNRIYFDIIPRLRPGVHVHVHDIFLPDDYPREWVITENRSWNEQYLLRALLMYSTRFRVEFASSYAYRKHPERVRRALASNTGAAFGGGSFWFSA